MKYAPFVLICLLCCVDQRHNIEDEALVSSLVSLQKNYSEVTIDQMFLWNVQCKKDVKLKDYNGELVLLSDIVSDSLTLIYYMDKYSCTSCRDATLNKLEEFKKKYPRVKIMVLGDFETRNDFISLLRFRRKKGLVYLKREERLISKDINQQIGPCLFILNRELRMVYPLFVTTENQFLVNDYLYKCVGSLY